MEWRGCEFELLPIGRGRVLREGGDVAVLAIGKGCDAAMRAADMAAAEGVDVAVYDLRYAKPLDEGLLQEVATKFSRVVTVEDGVLRGGVGEAVTKFFADAGADVKVTTLGIDDRFVEQGTPAELYAECGYDAEGILQSIKQI